MTKGITHNEYGVTRNIKSKLINRLRGDGYYNDWVRFRGALVTYGVSPKIAWIVAACVFPPKDESIIAEVISHPAYTEIAANWANNKYPHPPEFEKHSNGVTINFSKFKEPASEEFKAGAEEVKQAPNKWNARWKKLANAVEIPNAPLVEEVLWVVAHRWTDPEDIDPEEAPSKAAVCKLSLAQESSANFANFLNNFESKLIPTRQVADAESRRDDGRPLSDLEELEALLDAEESAA